MEEQRWGLAPGEFNDKLLDNVHPAGWVNPDPAAGYDLAVVGAGTAGLVVAAGAAGLGARVALIEARLMGGDCLNTGCVPSKGMIRAGRAVRDIAAAKERGVTVGAVSIDFGKVMDRVREIRAGMSRHDSLDRFSRKLGVDVFLGRARFTSSASVEVRGATLHFKKAAVCTGGRPFMPPVPGLRETGCLTNEDIFESAELPPRLAIIGGGPIGCELAQAFARLGSIVTVIETGDRLLPREDPDAVRIVQQALIRDNVRLVLNARVLRAARKGEDKILAVEQQGQAIEIAADQILAAAGRAPNIEGLNLEAAGIGYDARSGVLVDETLRTTNKRVYAAGDVCSAYRFTHVADAHARIVIQNALFWGGKKQSSLILPWCIYTDPEVARVGISEEEVRRRGREVTTLTTQFSTVDRAVLDDEADGFARIHLHKKTDRILGAAIVGRHAGEMISEVTLAMSSGLGLSAIGNAIHPYPTRAEALRKLADQYNRTRLTPGVRKLLAWRFRFLR